VNGSYCLEAGEKEKTMQTIKIGDVVEVQTKHFGKQTGKVVEVMPNHARPQLSQFLVKPFAHPRNIISGCRSIKLALPTIS
jgi:transcription antitermination factor NusG